MTTTSHETEALHWCLFCTAGNCDGEHAGPTTVLIATGGGARDLFNPSDEYVEVPGAFVMPMFSKPSADDEPFVSLKVSDGEIHLRAHEARALAELLLKIADNF